MSCKSTTSTQKLTIIDETDAFVVELNKKIRNKQKKLDQISQLEAKIKNKEIVANEEQRGKIATKAAVAAEISDVKTYIDLYKTASAKRIEKASSLAKQHDKELQQAKTFSVRQFANLLTIYSLNECG